MAFPSELPPRPDGGAGASSAGASWKERNCPGFRNCLYFDWDAYKLEGPSSIGWLVLARRLSQWITLVTRCVVSIVAIIRGVYGANVAGYIIGSIIWVLALFWVAHCLACIGRVWGTRKVFGWGVVSFFFSLLLFPPSPPPFFFWFYHFLCAITLLTPEAQGRVHWDLLLTFSVVIHIFIFIATFVPQIYLTQAGYLIAWYGMWVLLTLAWWITTWAPEGQSAV